MLDCKPSHDSYSKVADRQWLQRHAATQRPADRARPHFGRLSSTLADLPNVSNAADVSNVATAALLRASRPLLHDARVHRVHMAPLGVGAPLPDLPDMSDAADVSNVADVADALQLPSPA